jgi:hypothetical protein
MHVKRSMIAVAVSLGARLARPPGERVYALAGSEAFITS